MAQQSITSMDNLVLKIRELSLRYWVLISIALCVFAILPLMGRNSINGYIAALILGQLSGCLYLASLAAYAIDSLQKVKVALIIIMIGFAISVFGVYNALSGFWGGWIGMVNAFTEIPMEEMVEYLTFSMATYNVIQNLAFIIVFIIGISSFNKRYIVPWVILMCVYILIFLNQILLNKEIFTYDEYTRFGSVTGVLSFIVMIVTLVIGGKEIKNGHTLNGNTSTTGSDHSLQSTAISESFKSKSEALFQLKELLNSGVLTPEEFEIEKVKILNQ